MIHNAWPIPPILPSPPPPPSLSQTPQDPPLPTPPPPPGASGQQLVGGGGVIGVQNRGVPPPPPREVAAAKFIQCNMQMPYRWVNRSPDTKHWLRPNVYPATMQPLFRAVSLQSCFLPVSVGCCHFQLRLHLPLRSLFPSLCPGPDQASLCLLAQAWLLQVLTSQGLLDKYQMDLKGMRDELMSKTQHTAEVLGKMSEEREQVLWS